MNPAWVWVEVEDGHRWWAGQWEIIRSRLVYRLWCGSDFHGYHLTLAGAKAHADKVAHAAASTPQLGDMDADRSPW